MIQQGKPTKTLKMSKYADKYRRNRQIDKAINYIGILSTIGVLIYLIFDL